MHRYRRIRNPILTVSAQTRSRIARRRHDRQQTRVRPEAEKKSGRSAPPGWFLCHACRDQSTEFNAHSIVFLIVDAQPLAHGHIRAPKDLDVWIRAEPADAEWLEARPTDATDRDSVWPAGPVVLTGPASRSGPGCGFRDFSGAASPGSIPLHPAAEPSARSVCPEGSEHTTGPVTQKT